MTSTMTSTTSGTPTTPTAPSSTAATATAIGERAPGQRVNPPTATPLLQVQDLRVAFRRYQRGLRQADLTVVDGMSLHVSRGEVVALVGASGAGKSLLAYSVLGFLPTGAIEEGTVAWQGRALGPGERARLAGRNLVLLPQVLSALDPTATVRSQARRAARLVGRPARDGMAAVLATGLDADVLRLYPHQLSGGMARRVLRAIALIGEPDLVIADEPTPGLGRREADEVLDHLRSLADAGRGVLLITHDIALALRVTDRVVVVREGRSLDEAAVADFSGDGSRLQHPYTRALWRALPSQGFRLPEIESPGTVRSDGGVPGGDGPDAREPGDHEDRDAAVLARQSC